MGCNCNTDALIKHVRGNVLRLAIPLTVKIRDLVDGQPTERVEDFYPDASRGVKIVLDASYITRTFDGAVSGNVVSMEDRGTLKLGYYQVEVLCYDNSGIPYRYMARNIIAIVDATADAGIETDIEFDSETYTLEGAYFIKGEKGDKGDPFTYDDFTSEQIAELQRPATEAAERADQAIADMNTLEQQVEAIERQRETAETERQQSEAARQTQEASRQSAEQSRAQKENTRNSNETTRQSNEQQRQQNETQRASQATADHSRALSDHERAGNDHAASVSATTSADNAAAAATQAKEKMEQDVQTLIENTDAVLGANDIPKFDPDEPYSVGAFVMNDGKLYKFLTGHEPGAWNPQEVKQTNLVYEVNDMVKSDYEEVIIDLKTETDDPLPNVEVVVTVEGEQSGRNLTTDAQGRCTTNVQKGLEYTVSCANVPNYLPVTDIVRRALLPTRYITVTYVEDDTLTRETVKITVGYSDQTLPKATWARISYGGENYQLALNDQNIAETTVRLGTVYTVSFEDIDGYKTPSPQTYTASLHGTRNINVSYVAPVAGLKWLMSNNTERELNDVSDLERINGDIFGLIVQTSDLMAAGCSFVIPLPFLLTQSATGTGLWLSANVTVPQLNYFGSLQAALADFDGDANCAGIEQFIAESAQQGTTYTSSMVSNCRGRVGGAPSFDDTKSYEAGDYVVYRNYLHLFLVDHAAGPWVDGETEQMTGFLMPDGVVRKCFSPAFAQIYAFRLLRDKVNEFTTSVFGIGSCNIARGAWWCSTQYSASNGVALNGGAFYGITKNGSYNLLPILAY